MACTTYVLSGIPIDCGSIGGLSKLYIAPVADVVSMTIAADGLGDAITAITMASNKKFKTFNFRKGNANFTSEGSQDDAAGTYFVTTTLTAQFNKMETVKRTEMVALARTNCYVIAKDMNGIYWFIGNGSYCIANAAANSGAQRADSNNYTLTITSETNDLPIEVGAVTGLI